MRQEWDTLTNSHAVHTVLVEWDGNRPPTRWYNRLARMGLHVAGDKGSSPLARRSGGRGVIHQEGAILVETESEARILAHMARHCGAVAVTVGLLEIHETTMSDEDVQALRRIEQTLGKRGRPAESKQWVITCHDCLSSTESEATTPVNCPKCGSFAIHYREGTAVKLIAPAGGPLYRAWVTSRFVTGNFEVPVWDSNGVALSGASPVILNDADVSRVRGLENSPVIATITALLDSGRIHRDTALRALDEAYRNLSLSKEGRQKARLDGLQRYFVSGGQQDGILLTSNSGAVDVFDILSRIPEYTLPLIKMGTAVLGLAENA